MPSMDELLTLIDRLYECAANGSWAPAVDAAAQMFGAHRAALAIHDMRNLGMLATEWLDVDEPYQRSYPTVYMQPDMKALAAKVVASAGSYNVVTEDFQAKFPETYRTRFYDEWLRPQRMDRQLLVQGPP